MSAWELIKQPYIFNLDTILRDISISTYSMNSLRSASPVEDRPKFLPDMNLFFHEE